MAKRVLEDDNASHSLASESSEGELAVEASAEHTSKKPRPNEAPRTAVVPVTNQAPRYVVHLQGLSAHRMRSRDFENHAVSSSCLPGLFCCLTRTFWFVFFKLLPRSLPIGLISSFLGPFVLKPSLLSPLPPSLPSFSLCKLELYNIYLRSPSLTHSFFYRNSVSLPLPPRNYDKKAVEVPQDAGDEAQRLALKKQKAQVYEKRRYRFDVLSEGLDTYLGDKSPWGQVFQSDPTLAEQSADYLEGLARHIRAYHGADSESDSDSDGLIHDSTSLNPKYKGSEIIFVLITFLTSFPLPSKLLFSSRRRNSSK